MKSLLRLIPILALAAAGLLACGGSDVGEPDKAAAPTATLPAQEEAAAVDVILTGQPPVAFANVPGLAPSPHYKFRVRARVPGSPWFDSFAFVTTAKDPRNNVLNDTKYFRHLSGWSHTYTNFVMTEPVEVEISRVDGTAISSAAVHPQVRARPARIREGKVYVAMNQPAQIAVDIDGRMDTQNTGDGYSGPPIHTVSVFANPPLTNVPRVGDPGVYAVAPGSMPPTDGSAYTALYFLPGVHDIGKSFPVWANKSYYIPTDAIVYGSFNSTRGGSGNGRNIRILGHGTLSGERIAHPDIDTSPKPAGVTKGANNPIYLEGALNTSLEGLTIADSAFHSVQMWAGHDPTKPTAARWVKVLTWRINGDGINPGGNMTIEDSFLRTQDDAIYVNGRGMKRLVLWNDANGAAFILWNMPSRPLVVEDSDVIYSRASWRKWGGGRVFSLRAEGSRGYTAGGQATFRNIRVEDRFPTYQAFFLVTSADFPDSYISNPTRVGSGITGVTFQNISIAARSFYGYPESLHGHPAAPVSDLTFDNVVIGGVPVSGLSDFSNVNQHVTNITFK